MSTHLLHDPIIAYESLLTSPIRHTLREQLTERVLATAEQMATEQPVSEQAIGAPRHSRLADTWISKMTAQWQAVNAASNSTVYSETTLSDSTLKDHAIKEQQLTDWLIELFNTTFAHQNTVLVRGDHEPEYFPAATDTPAQIVFAHGFFASALHEISHWCIAGQQRRTLVDYGYWYAADGRNEAQQQAFEQVEIKPQALECLFTLACQRPFRVSQDNLFADFDTSQSTFAQDVYEQAQHYIDQPATLPRDAQRLLAVLLTVCG